MLFIDDNNTKVTWIYLMKENSEAKSISQNFMP